MIELLLKALPEPDRITALSVSEAGDLTFTWNKHTYLYQGTIGGDAEVYEVGKCDVPIGNNRSILMLKLLQKSHILTTDISEEVGRR